VLSHHREGSGEPPVLVHALGASWELWRPVLPALAERRDVIAVDLPGFGGSPPAAESSVPAFADAVEATLDELGGGEADVVGNSMLFEHSAEGLEQVDVPVLIAWGSRDLLLPSRHADRFVSAIPRSELRILDGLGHAPMGDDPEVVAEMILEFVERER
jgi:pimeloyl-ACP methyl ester carboxylesterase